MLKQDRALSEKIVPHAPEFGHSVAQGFRVFRGSIVAVCEDGTIVPAGSSNTPSPLVSVVGIARHYQDNTGVTDEALGNSAVWVKKGCYALPFDVVPGWVAVGQAVYAVDDETVSLNSGAAAGGEPTKSNPATRLPVGILAGLETGTPYVLIS